MKGYSQIETERKLHLTNRIKEIIQQRNKEKEELIKLMIEYNTNKKWDEEDDLKKKWEEKVKPVILAEKDDRLEVPLLRSGNVIDGSVTGLIKNISDNNISNLFANIGNIKENNDNLSILSKESQTTSQKLQLAKDLTITLPLKETQKNTIFSINIPLSENLTNKYITPFLNQPKPTLNSEFLQIKRIINKRMSQLSTEIDHIKEISKEMLPYSQNPHFLELFTKKIIEMGKIQVSVHKDSYKSYSFFCTLIYNENKELLTILSKNVFTVKEADGNALKGIYLIYFGVLKILKLYDEVWFFFKGILNIKPCELSLYVMEGLVAVFGRDMMSYYGDEFGNVSRFIKEEYCKIIDNEAVKTRIFSLLDKMNAN